MNKQLPNAMTEALRLTLAGQPGEATAEIQRSLGVLPPHPTPLGDPAEDEAVDASYHVVSVDQSPGGSVPPAVASPRVVSRTPDAGGQRTVSVHEPGVPDPTRQLVGERTAAKLTDTLASIQHTLDRTVPNLASPLAGLSGWRVPATRPRLGVAVTPGSARPQIEAGGRFVAGRHRGPAGSRDYKLYVPTGYTGQPVPLVVMLHGCAQGADDSAAGTRLNQLAEQHSWLIVYPEQVMSANSSRCWNWFQAADQDRDVGEPSLIAGITREVMATYHVDPDRVYVAGMSAGGAMAAIMGEAYPDLYAAVGVHSGLARGAAADLPSAFGAMQGGGPHPAAQDDRGSQAPLPLIVFHGDQDRTVHPRNGERVLARALRLSTGTPHQPDMSVRGQVPGGHAYTRTVYHDAHDQVVAEHWLVHGAAHAWSGGSPAGSFTDRNGPDAAVEMLRFFREHPRAPIPATRGGLPPIAGTSVGAN